MRRSDVLGLPGAGTGTGAGGGARAGRLVAGHPAAGRSAPGGPRRSAKLILATLAALLSLLAAMAGSAGPALAAGNPYQRGPDPTVASIEASRGTFATAQVTVAPGNGFGGGVVYYPTDTSQGTWGALAIVPGYTAKCANEEAWMGPWLSSFGFVVICIETNTTTDSDSQRAAELLAALNWLSTASPVKNEVDPGRLSVLGHSAGGAGAIEAAEQQPALKAMIGLAPGFPGMGLSMATDHVPSLIVGGQNDTVVTPSYLSSLYATVPASTQSDFAQIAGADHVYYTHPNNVEMKLIIPWLKVFVDDDTRYTQFLCPTLPDPSGVSIYQSKCPYVPPGGTPPPQTVTVTNPGAQTGTVGTAITGVQIQGADSASGQTLTYSATGLPAGLSISSSGLITGTPTTAGSSTVKVTATDGTGASGSTTFTWTVSGGSSGGVCHVAYTKASEWPGGFTANVVITNTGTTAINGWTLGFTFPGDQKITNAWSATTTQNGEAVTATNVSYNASIAPGANTSFGFQGTFTSNDNSPTSFTVNGNTCS